MSKNTVYVVGAHGSEWWLDLQAVRFFFTAKATETQTIWNTWTLLILKELNQLNESFWWIFGAFGWHTENILLNAWKTYLKKTILQDTFKASGCTTSYESSLFCLPLLSKLLIHAPPVVRLGASLTYHNQHSADRNTSYRSIIQGFIVFEARGCTSSTSHKTYMVSPLVKERRENI